jgi:hypothetical protein
LGFFGFGFGCGIVNLVNPPTGVLSSSLKRDTGAGSDHYKASRERPS